MIETHSLTAADVASLEPWFADRATTKWIGDPAYPRHLLKMASHHGRHAFVVTDGCEPVALVDVELDEPRRSAAIALVVAPGMRGRGVGRAAVEAVTQRPEFAGVADFVGEVEDGNEAARRCVLAAGFRLAGPAKDAGFTRYVLSLAGAVLVTGVSGTGKSTALIQLAERGFRVVDTDDPGWKERRDGEWIWREDRIADLLASAKTPTLFVSGCVSNQGGFYDRFDAVVLLSAPAEVILERIRTRTTNNYGRAGLNES